MSGKSKRPNGGKRRGAGRPPLGDAARTVPLLVRLTADEHAEVTAKVERHNANLADGERPTTVTAWIRARGLS